MNDKTVEEMFLNQSGRLNRLRYFKRVMAIFLVSLVAMLPVTIIFGDDFGNLSSFGNILVTLINLAILIPFYCLDVRRLHDMDKDETLAKVSLAIGISVAIIPVDDIFSVPTPLMIVYLIGTVLGLYMLFSPGTKGENQYGADPLA